MKIKMENNRPITDISADYGYSSSNYGSAFSLYHKKSPSVFRDKIQENLSSSLQKNQSFYENTCILTGGKFVVYSFKGYLKDIYPINQQLIGIWFQKNNYKIDDRYAYDQYYLVDGDYIKLDICIPIK